SAEGMKILVDNLNNDGDIDNGQTLEALRLHLTAISHYEKQDKTEKIIKHMEDFKKLVDRQKNDQSISNKAYSFLMTQADRFIEKWTDETIDLINPYPREILRGINKNEFEKAISHGHHV